MRSESTNIKPKQPLQQHNQLLAFVRRKPPADALLIFAHAGQKLRELAIARVGYLQAVAALVGGRAFAPDQPLAQHARHDAAQCVGIKSELIAQHRLRYAGLLRHGEQNGGLPRRCGERIEHLGENGFGFEVRAAQQIGKLVGQVDREQMRGDGSWLARASYASSTRSAAADANLRRSGTMRHGIERMTGAPLTGSN